MRSTAWRVLGLRLGLGSGLALAGTGCQFDSTGLGLETTEASNGTTTTADTTATSGVDPTEETSAITRGTATGEVTTTGPSSTEDGTTSSDESPLIERGLLARWYIDEVGPGNTTMWLRDSQYPAVDLSLVSIDGAPTYTELDDNRGLSWPGTGLDGRPQASIMRTKLHDKLGGATQATFELVLAVEEVDGATSRFLHIGPGSNDDFAIGADGTDELQVRWRGASTRYFPATLSGDRQVLHVVVDTELPEEEEAGRTRVYLDGVELTPSGNDVPDEDAQLPLQMSSSLTLGNRTDGQRSFQGQLYYAAIYLGAFAPGDVQANASALLQDDDGP